MDTNVATLVAAIIGGLIGGGLSGWLTMKATDKAHNHTKELEDYRQKQDVKSFLQAVYDELETLWQAYQLGIGSELTALKEGDALRMTFPIQQDYFTVYRANAQRLGLVDDHDLRRQIVITYTRANSMIDSIRQNNQFLMELDHWNRVFSETQSQNHQLFAQTKFAALVDYAKKLKIGDQGLRKDISILTNMLLQQGVLSHSGDQNRLSLS